MSDVDSRLSSPEGTRPRPDYRSKTNLKLKVLDFVKSGGLCKTELRTFRWEVSLKG